MSNLGNNPSSQPSDQHEHCAYSHRQRLESVALGKGQGPVYPSAASAEACVSCLASESFSPKTGGCEALAAHNQMGAQRQWS